MYPSWHTPSTTSIVPTVVAFNSTSTPQVWQCWNNIRSCDLKTIIFFITSYVTTIFLDRLCHTIFWYDSSWFYSLPEMLARVTHNTTHQKSYFALLHHHHHHHQNLLLLVLVGSSKNQLMISTPIIGTGSGLMFITTRTFNWESAGFGWMLTLSGFVQDNTKCRADQNYTHSTVQLSSKVTFARVPDASCMRHQTHPTHINRCILYAFQMRPVHVSDVHSGHVPHLVKKGMAVT